MQNNNYKKIASAGMLCAAAYIAVVLFRVPIVLFLKYEPKDIIITIGGFIYGPLTSFLISVIVSLIEMFTISDTGIIGCIMNILSSCAFACTAAVIYKKKHTLSGAVAGLISGTVALTAVMLLWNYLITPLYMTMPREEVAKLLIPAFLPFNLLKGGLNTAFTLIIYKPLVKALRSANLIPESVSQNVKKGFSAGIFIFSAVIIITSVLVIMVMNGKI